jgi:hypothetical protein
MKSNSKLIVVVLVLLLTVSCNAVEKDFQETIDQVSSCKHISDVEKVFGRPDYVDHLGNLQYENVFFRGIKGRSTINSINHRICITFVADEPVSTTFFQETKTYFDNLYGNAKYGTILKYYQWCLPDGSELRLYDTTEDYFEIAICI